MYIHKLLKLTSFVALLPIVANAASDHPIAPALPAKALAVFISLDAASLFAHPGSTQEVNLYGSAGNTYVVDNSLDNNTTLMAGIGLRVFKNDWLQVNTSVRYLPMTGMKVEGDIWQFHSPQFDNLAYSYQIKSNLVLVDNIFSWTKYRFQPGIIIGLGRSYNIVDSYQEWPLNNTATSSPSVFSGAHTEQFAYELGAVFDYTFKKLVIEAAYRFIDAGQGQLDLSSIQNTTDRLSTGNLHYQTVSLGIRLYYDV